MAERTPFSTKIDSRLYERYLETVNALDLKHVDIVTQWMTTWLDDLRRGEGGNLKLIIWLNESFAGRLTEQASKSRRSPEEEATLILLNGLDVEEVADTADDQLFLVGDQQFMELQETADDALLNGRDPIRAVVRMWSDMEVHPPASLEECLRLIIQRLPVRAYLASVLKRGLREP